MISPDMFPSTEMDISEKWDCSSTNYTSKNWKRNNHAWLRSKFQNWDIFVEIVSSDAGIVDTDITAAIDVHKKENFI